LDPAALDLMGRHAIIRWGSNPPLDWSSQTAIVVASGPSAAATDFELLRGRRLIAVNLSWRLVPWADVLYGTDGHFWHFYKGIPEFAGRKVTSSPMAAQSLGIDCLFCDGNNSGVRAINLAEACGSKRILLIGFDMRINGQAHWHEAYPKGKLPEPTDHNARQWRNELKETGHRFAKRGTTIINCTPGSALECFPKMSLHEAL
jgi:hypothetical protein